MLIFEKKHEFAANLGYSDSSPPNFCFYRRSGPANIYSVKSNNHIYSIIFVFMKTYTHTVGASLQGCKIVKKKKMKKKNQSASEEQRR